MQYLLIFILFCSFSGTEAIKTYLKGLEGETIELKRARIVLIGDGEVGKTSFKICVSQYYPTISNITPKLPEKEERTIGIDVDEFKPREEGFEDFTLSFWDFG